MYKNSIIKLTKNSDAIKPEKSLNILKINKKEKFKINNFEIKKILKTFLTIH